MPRTTMTNIPNPAAWVRTLLLCLLPLLIDAHGHVRARILEDHGDGMMHDDGDGAGMQLLGLVLLIVILACVCALGTLSWFCCCGEGACGGIFQQAEEAVDM